MHHPSYSGYCLFVKYLLPNIFPVYLLYPITTAAALPGSVLLPPWTIATLLLKPPPPWQVFQFILHTLARQLS